MLLLRDNAADVIDQMFKDLNLDIFRIHNDYQQENYVLDIADFATVIGAGEASLGRTRKVLMSGWSPPTELKSNNQQKNGGTLASDPETGTYRYADHARWWADSLDYYNAQGIQIDYLSMQNEPNWAAPHDTCLLDPKESATIAGYNTAFDAVYQEISSRSVN